MKYTIIDQDGIPYKKRCLPKHITVLAYKKEISSGCFIYFVMCSKYGDLFNQRTGDSLHKSKTSLTKEKKFDLTRCSKTVYEYYSTYLRSLNYRHFLIAERKLKNEQ